MNQRKEGRGGGGGWSGVLCTRIHPPSTYIRRFLVFIYISTLCLVIKNMRYCSTCLYFLIYKSISHTEKSFRNLLKSNRNQTVVTVFRLIWIQTDVRLVPNQSENGNYNLISGWFNKISKTFFCVYTEQTYSCPRNLRLSRRQGA